MRRFVSLVLCLVMACMFVTQALAADPDMWMVDSNRQNIGTMDNWEPVGDGVSDGMGMFPDFGMAMLWLYGKRVASNFGWWLLHLRP